MAAGNAYRFKFYLDFSGGQNDTLSEVKAAQASRGREVLKLRNVDLDRDGALSRRFGAVLLEDTGLGGCNGLWQVLPAGGAAVLLGYWGDEIRTWDGTSWLGAGNLLLDGLQDRIALLATLKNLAWIQNGVDVPLVYYQTGTAPYVFRAGTPQPTSLSDGGSIAGTLTPGDKYLLRVRYASVIDGSFMGEPYPEDGLEITVGAGGGNVINLPVYAGGALPTDYRVGHRILERTTVGATPGGTYFFAADIPDNTTLTFNMDGSEILGQIMPDLGTRSPMPKLWPFLVHNNRVFGADTEDRSKIVWSEIDEFGILPEAFPAENYHFLDVEDGQDLPELMLKFGDFVAIYCGRSVHLLSVDQGGDSYAQRMGGHRLGVPSARMGIELPEGNVVWTYKGPYLFSPMPTFLGEKNEAELKNIVKAGLVEGFALHRAQEQRRQVLFVLPRAGVQNEYAAKYHYRRPTLSAEAVVHAWAFDDNFRAKSGCMAQEAGDEIEYTGDYDGKFFRADFGSLEERTGTGSIDGIIETFWLDCDEPQNVKTYTDLWAFLSGPSATMSVAWESTFGAGASGSAALTVPGAGAIFDIAIFDTDVFAMGETLVLHTQLGKDGVGAVGRYLKLKFTSSDQFTLVGFLLKYHTARERDDASS